MTAIINKQEDLKRIRNKFINNRKLSSFDCSLIIAFPIFETGESETEIVEEMCLNIKNKKHCIPDDELDKLVVGMYLNIVEYIDINRQEELMEMINLKEETQGIVAQLRNEGFNKGRLETLDEIKKSQLDFLLKSHSIEEISDFFGMPYEDAFNNLFKN